MVSTAENKALVRRFYDALNTQDYAALDAVLAPDFTYNGMALGREGMKQVVAMRRTAFADFIATIEELVAEGELVAVYYTYSGRHVGEFPHPTLGRLAPSGKSFRTTGMDLYRIRDGRLVELRDRPGTLEVLQQLGHLPAPSSAPTA